MRVLPVLFIVTLATPVTAQTERDSFQSLQRILQPSDDRRDRQRRPEVTGTISSVSDCQRRSIRQLGSAFTPVLSPNGFALHVSLSF